MASCLRKPSTAFSYSIRRAWQRVEPLRLVVLHDIPEDQNLRGQWNALVERVDQPQVFFTYEWALAVQRAYHTELHPLLFLAYDEQDNLLGVAALATHPEPRRVSFLSATTGDYCDFLSLSEHKREFVAGVLVELRKQGVESITMTNLPADSKTVSAIRAESAQTGYRCFARTAYVCAQVEFQKLEKGQDGKPVAPGQKRVRRFVKAVAGEGPLRLEHSRSWDAVAPVLPQFMQAHVARFLEIGRISNIASPLRRVFLQELAKLLSDSQWLVMSRLRIGEEPVAWHYGFQFHDNWFWYQPTFDSRQEKHWPGFCLLTQVIQDAIENPALTRLDLGLGSEAYKAKFANGSRETLYLTLHRSVLAHSAAVLRHCITEAIKAYPTLERFATGMRHSLQVLRRRFRSQGLANTLRFAAKRLGGLVWSREEVVFSEWEGDPPGALRSQDVHLRPLDLNQLAITAMESNGDERTADYLLRSAKRLRAAGVTGFVLLQGESPVHFAWVAAFNGFHCSELNAALQGPADSVLLFDCWTPTAARGHGYYSQAVDLVARELQEQGKTPWIFSAGSNVESLRGLAKTGFRPRYSLVRKRLLGWQWVEGSLPWVKEAHGSEVSAHI